MTLHILKCPKCGSYTMHENCNTCKEKTVQPIPAKYSPEDNYGKYRREVKKDSLKEKGLL
jgi:H/ACA ribonucleoprotein complex subunit 3